MVISLFFVDDHQYFFSRIEKIMYVLEIRGIFFSRGYATGHQLLVSGGTSLNLDHYDLFEKNNELKRWTSYWAISLCPLGLLVTNCWELVEKWQQRYPPNTFLLSLCYEFHFGRIVILVFLFTDVKKISHPLFWLLQTSS